MPFSLSVSLTLNTVMWFFNGLLIKDFNIAIPNILGFGIGIHQMVLYVVYKDKKKVLIDEEKKLPVDVKTQVIVLDEENKLHEALAEQVIDVVKLSAMLCPKIVSPGILLALPLLVLEGEIFMANKNKEVVMAVLF